MEKEQDNKKKKRILLVILGIILLFFGAIYCGYYAYLRYEAAHQETPTQYVTEEASVEDGVKNPVNFKKLQKQNSDVYAWLKVPGTKVNHPIVQSPVDDSFYLKHSAEDKSWVANGAVYTERCNTKTFNDRVTVIYGHNGYSDTMFTTLHRFEEESFFKEHKRFVIYTPESKLTYRIISAFKYDDRHIINSFDFEDLGVYAGFLGMIENPQTTNKNVATDFGRQLTIDDKVVVLSTCITHQPSSRYLVCGVLVKNEKTY